MDKPTQGKLLSGLTALEHSIVFQKVNQAPEGRGITQAERSKRFSLYEKVVADADMNETTGLVKFNDDSEIDMLLSNSEWDCLKTCFTQGVDANMMMAQKTNTLLKKIEDAPSHELEVSDE